VHRSRAVFMDGDGVVEIGHAPVLSRKGRDKDRQTSDDKQGAARSR
jgi:hypothetical protein